MLANSNKSDKLHEVAQLELYRGSLNYEFLVVFWVALVWLLLVFDFRIFVEFIVEKLLTIHVTGFIFEK